MTRKLKDLVHSSYYNISFDITSFNCNECNYRVTIELLKSLKFYYKGNDLTQDFFL